MRSLIVFAIRDDRAVVFDQLHDVAVFGLMVDVMRGKARRWSESVISRELKCGRGELKLFDAFDFSESDTDALQLSNNVSPILLACIRMA